MVRLVPLLALGCSSGGDEPPSIPASVAPAEVEGTVVDAACATTDHPLRFRCELSTVSDLEVLWTVRRDEVVVRRFTTSGTAHEQLLWGLAEGEVHTWEAEAEGGWARGELTAGSTGLDKLSIRTTGTPPDLDGVLVPLQCAQATGLVMFDGEGRVIWFQRLMGGSSDVRGGVTGFQPTHRGFVVGLEDDRVVEVTADGTVVRELTGFGRPLHHDLAADDQGRIYVLNAHEVGGYVLDGVQVFDGDEEVARFELSDHVDPRGGRSEDRFWAREFPGAVDWSHTNSIELGPDGLGLLSLKAQDTVLAVVLDPDADDFGSIRWTLTGDDSDLVGDFTWTDGGSFDGQHHVSWGEPGQVRVFDNASGVSRGLVLALGDSVVAESMAYPLDVHCPIQGSVYPLPDGGMLVTCATVGEVTAFDATGAVTWSADVSCGLGQPLARALPVHW